MAKAKKCKDCVNYSLMPLKSIADQCAVAVELYCVYSVEWGKGYCCVVLGGDSGKEKYIWVSSYTEDG